MYDLIRHDDVLHFHREQRETENVNRARKFRRAVGNILRQRHTVDDLAVRAVLAEWILAEHRQESVFRRHLVFRLHADVIHLSLLGIGVHHELRASAAQRRAVEYRWSAGNGCSDLRAVDAVGNDRRVQIRYGRIGAHKKINVRFRSCRIGVRIRKHAFARNRQRVRQKGHKRRVGKIRVVHHDVEMPLVRLADGDGDVGAKSRVRAGVNRVRAEQRRACADKLVQQRHVVGENIGDVLAGGRIGNDAIVRHRDRIRRLPFAVRDHQRIILHDVRLKGSGGVVRLRGDGVHVHVAPDDGDGKIRADARRQENILDVVDGIHGRRGIRGRRGIINAAGRNIVAEKDDGIRRVVEVRHNQYETVDQLDGGGGIARRIRPRQRRAQRQ